MADALDREFLDTIAAVESEYDVLDRGKQIRVEKWCAKLAGEGGNDTFRKNRNAFALSLLLSVRQREFHPPLDRLPPDGALPALPRHMTVIHPARAHSGRRGGGRTHVSRPPRAWDTVVSLYQAARGETPVARPQRGEGPVDAPGEERVAWVTPGEYTRAHVHPGEAKVEPVARALDARVEEAAVQRVASMRERWARRHRDCYAAATSAECHCHTQRGALDRGRMMDACDCGLGTAGECYRCRYRPHSRSVSSERAQRPHARRHRARSRSRSNSTGTLARFLSAHESTHEGRAAVPDPPLLQQQHRDPAAAPAPPSADTAAHPGPCPAAAAMTEVAAPETDIFASDMDTQRLQRGAADRMAALHPVSTRDISVYDASLLVTEAQLQKHRLRMELEQLRLQLRDASRLATESRDAQARAEADAERVRVMAAQQQDELDAARRRLETRAMKPRADPRDVVRTQTADPARRHPSASRNDSFSRRHARRSGTEQHRARPADVRVKLDIQPEDTERDDDALLEHPRTAASVFSSHANTWRKRLQHARVEVDDADAEALMYCSSLAESLMRDGTEDVLQDVRVDEVASPAPRMRARLAQRPLPRGDTSRYQDDDNSFVGQMNDVEDIDDVRVPSTRNSASAAPTHATRGPLVSAAAVTRAATASVTERDIKQNPSWNVALAPIQLPSALDERVRSAISTALRVPKLM